MTEQEDNGVTIITMDCGSEIQAGAMVKSKILYLDYKCPLPQHVDKVVVVEADVLRGSNPPPDMSMYARLIEIDPTALGLLWPASKAQVFLTSTPKRKNDE